ncbi:hypothetical protein HPB48_004199 [Haemaphysalis longicornis]|uniref:CCHC-type domain-containing protein n=1 Tax=Haemaphysalis longicornis TaxID=44386 RepID=A0A9J6GWQ7_HAELO|nr:hypothetical protein HPB48_004199 [Haemaphysalis longicornis]
MGQVNLIAHQVLHVPKEVCCKCGDIGHQSDICSNHSTEKCRKCGDPSPASEQRCVAKCQLCAKEHETGDKRCKVVYRTLYVHKKDNGSESSENRQGKKNKRKRSRCT